jgi:uncharacterized membrane protein YfhO
VIVREVFDSGWQAEVDGAPVAVTADRGAFLAVPVAAGTHSLVVRYDPAEVRIAAAIALGAAAAALAAVTRGAPPISLNSGGKAWTGCAAELKSIS